MTKTSESQRRKTRRCGMLFTFFIPYPHSGTGVGSIACLLATIYAINQSIQSLSAVRCLASIHPSIHARHGMAQRIEGAMQPFSSLPASIPVCVACEEPTKKNYAQLFCSLCYFWPSVLVCLCVESLKIDGAETKTEGGRKAWQNTSSVHSSRMNKYSVECHYLFPSIHSFITCLKQTKKQQHTDTLIPSHTTYNNN